VRRLNRFSFSLLVFPKTERHTRAIQKKMHSSSSSSSLSSSSSSSFPSSILSLSLGVFFSLGCSFVSLGNSHSLLLLYLPLLSEKKTKQVPHRGGYSRDDISRHRKLIRAD
jgi:hypothetical protein